MSALRPALVAFVFSLLLLLPAYIFHTAGHDAHIHGLWTKNFAALLSDGHVYPRFANDMTAGFGSFIFFFYPPLSLYLSSIFAGFGHDADFYYMPELLSANLALFCSGMAAYFWLRRKLGQAPALLASVFYMALPAHLLVDFYITAGIAQFWCYAWFPLILLGVEKTAARERGGVVMAAVAAAALVMTNIPATLVFAPFAVCYALAVAPRRSWPEMALAGILAAGLAAVYVLPVLAYWHLVNIDLHWGVFGFRPENYFLDKSLFAPGHSYRIIVLVAYAVTALYSLLFTVQMPHGRVRKLLFFILCAAFFLCFSPSAFLWKNVPLLDKIQFPRRFLIIPTVFIMVPVAALLAENSAATIKRLKILIGAMMVMNFIFAYETSSHIDARANSNIAADWKNDTETFPNYLPGKELIPFFYPLSPEAAAMPKAAVEGGEVKINRWESRDISLTVTGDAGSEIGIRQFYFPYWQARLDGEEIAVGDDGNLKTLAVKLPRKVQDAELSLELATLPAERLGMIISAISLLITALIYFRSKNAKI